MSKQTATAAAIPAAPAAAPMAAPVPSPAPAPGFSFRDCGAALARNDAARARFIKELGENLQGATLAQWEMARAEFITGAEDVGYKAPAKLWERIVELGQEMGHISDKPKSDNPESAAKAERRAKAKAEREADTRTAAELATQAAQAAEAIKAVDPTDTAKLLEASRAAAKLAAEAQAKAKAEAKAKAKADADALAPLMARLKADTKVLSDAADRQGLEMLARVAHALATGQHAKVGKMLKALPGLPPADPLPAAPM